MAKTVIAIVSGGEPLVRTAIQANHSLVYLANPALMDEIRAGLTGPVGFPWEDVFEYEPDVYDEIRAAWTEGRPVPSDRLRPLGEFAT